MLKHLIFSEIDSLGNLRRNISVVKEQLILEVNYLFGNEMLKIASDLPGLVNKISRKTNL